MIDRLIKSAIKRIAEEELAKRTYFVEEIPSNYKGKPIIQYPPQSAAPQPQIPPEVLQVISQKYSLPNKPLEVKIVKEIHRRKKRSFKRGVTIPKIKGPTLTDVDKIRMYLGLELSNEKELRLLYPVTRYKIEDEEYTFAYAYISYDEQLKSLIYRVIEPQLEKKHWDIVDLTLRELEEKLDVPLDVLRDKNKAIDYLNSKVDEIWDLHGINLPSNIDPYVRYYIIRNTFGYGKIDPLMNDPNIEDISCNGVGIPIFVFHRNPYIGELQTNIVFNSDDELDAFVMKLAIRAGKALSVAQPLLDGALPDGSRVQITYGRDISRKGSSFTIRKFSKDPFTPIDLLNYETVDLSLLSYLWTLVEEGKSILIAGGTATGKTSMLNAISLFIRPEKKIVSIEDTPELQLPHPNWLPEVAREGFGPSKYGEVSLVDLLKAALRQRPDYIIVGEVRGPEAYILFQAMATGHVGMGTIHAESFESLIDRLISPPINLPPVLLETLDAVIFLKRMRYRGKFVRKVSEIIEILRYDHKKDRVIKNVSFKWNPRTNEFEARDSYLLLEIEDFKNWSDIELQSNLEFKARVLEYLWRNKIRKYDQFAKYIEMYYTDPERLANLISYSPKKV